jgi:iron complex outermembrane recepter protein
LLGNPEFDSERLLAYELGHRWQASSNLSFDLALFYNDYDRLASLEAGAPFIDPDTGQTVIPILNRNLTRGRSLGGELLVEWQPTDHWRLSGSYSGIDLRLEADGLDLNRGTWLDGSTPRGQFALRSLLTLGRFDIDAHFRHHTRIRRIPLDPGGAGFDAYSSLDLRVGWRLSPEWGITLVGQNLLDDEHLEFGGVTARGALERSAYLKAEWRR